jgi:uncharacterized repeat protein (TIGR02543 family)
MAFSLYLDETCLSTSCTYVEYSGGYLQWIDGDGGGDYVGTIYKDNDSHEFTYSGPSDLYLTTTYAGGTGSTGSTGSNTKTPWETTIEYYIGNENQTAKLQEVYSIDSYPSEIVNLDTLSIELLNSSIIIHYKNWGGSTFTHYEIKIPKGLKYSSISGANIGVDHDSLNKASAIKIYFTKDTSVSYKVNTSVNPTGSGTTSKNPSAITYYYFDKVTIKATPKVGYTFNKWSISNLSVNTTTSSSYTFYVTNNHNCVANFTPNTYNITYKDQGGGTFSGAHESGYPKTHIYGTETKLKSATKKGYTFEGWFTNSACTGIPITSLGAKEYMSDITLYAKWTLEEYTISYTNLNGATNPTSNPKKYTIETPTITFVKPTENLPEGYTWSKWNPSSITKGSTGNKTITAQWLTNKYTLTWNANGGTIPSSPAYTSGSVSYGTTITKPSNPTKTGHTFNGWKDQDGSTTIETTMPAKNLTYTAQWSVNSYIINLNGGSSSQTSVKINYGTSTFLNSSTGAVTTIKTPTKTGHTFRGWYTASGGNGYLIIDKNGVLQAKVTGYTNSSGKWTKAQDTTVYAYYTVNPYSITYKDKGNTTFSGNNSSSLPKTHTYGTATTLVNGSKTGYKFEGWYKDSACEGTAIKTLGATDYTSDITLFAKWTPEEYTITYYINGGTGTLEPTTYTVEDETFSLPEPTKSGYTFKGWYSNGSFSGSTTTQIAKGSTGNRTYYAKWEGNACTITVNANPSYLSEYVSGGKSCKVGDSVTISASAPGDYIVFNSWYCGNTFESSSNPYTFTAPGTRTYIGNFTDYRQKITFKFHVNPQYYTDTPDSIVDIFYGNTRTELSTVRRTRNGSNIVYEFDHSTDVTVNKYAGGSGTYLSSINNSLNSQDMYILPSSLGGNNLVGIYIGKNPTSDSETYKENELVLDVYYGKLPSFSDPEGPGTPSKQLKVRFNYWLDGVKLEKGTAAWETKWGEHYSPPEEIETWWIQYNGFEQDKKDYTKNIIKFTHHEIGKDYNYNNITDTHPELQEKLEIQAPINCYVYSVVGFDDNDLSKEYNTLTNTGEYFDVDINYKNVTYLAKATSNNTSIGDANINGSGTNGTTDVEFIIGQRLTFNALPKTGYKFTKWVNKNNTSQEYTSNPYIIEKAPAADVHYEAYFGPEEYTITLNPNGGSGSQSSVKIDYLSSSLKSTITNPTKMGHTFEGWYTTASGGSLVIGTDGKLQPNVNDYTNSSSQWTKTSGTTLYAHWTPTEYTITLEPNGGSGGKQTVKIDYLSDSLKSTITNPIRTGYTFSGWYTTASGGSKVIGTDKKLQPNVNDYTNSSSQWTKTSGTTLYAHWTPNKYTLTWDLKGGTVTTAGTCAPLNSTGVVSGQVEYLSDITAPIVSKKDYNFLGWSAENGNGVITPASKMPNGDVKYVAVYSTKTYKISVNSNPEELLDKVYILKGDDKNNKYTSTTCTTGDKITLVAENTDKYLLSYWQKSGGNVVSGQNEFTFTANDTYLDDTVENNIFTAYYNQDPRATLKINFIVDDFIEKTAIFKFNETFSFLGENSTEGYKCEIQGEAECIEGDIDINLGYFFIPSKYNGEDLCMVPHEQGSGTSKLICSNKGNTIGRDGYNSQYYKDNTAHNSYCPIDFEWQAYLPTNVAGETHLVFPSVEKEEYGILYGPLVIDVYYGEIPERFLPVIPEDVEITTVSGLTLLQRIQNKIATFKWLNNLFGEPEKTTWESYDNSGLKSFLKDDSKETPSSMHCIEYGDLQIYNQGSGNENINIDKTIKQYSLTLDNIIKPLNGQVVLDVSKIEGNKIYFNISNLSGFTNTSNGIYIYFSVNNETDENNATLYKMKLPKTSSNKGLLLTIPNISNIESLYIYRTPIMVDSTKTGIIPKIYFSSEKADLTISVHDRTTLNTVI